MDIMPYATKNENGRNPASPMLRSKLSMMSGTNGPRMFVRNEMTEKIKKMRRTISVLCFIIMIRSKKPKTYFQFLH